MKSLVLGLGVFVLGFDSLVYFCLSPASPKSPKVAQSDPKGSSGEGPLEGPLGVRVFCRARLERRLGFGVWKLGFEVLA